MKLMIKATNGNEIYEVLIEEINPDTVHGVIAVIKETSAVLTQMRKNGKWVK